LVTQRPIATVAWDDQDYQILTLAGIQNADNAFNDRILGNFCHCDSEACRLGSLSRP
jgi:hypothetical protein